MNAIWQAEWDYRYQERIAIMSDSSGVVTGEMRAAAKTETDRAIATMRVVAKKRRLTDLWCAEYQKALGHRYLFQGAKDGQAADRLLRLDVPVEEIIALAKDAWAHLDWFECKHSASLASFAARFNEIRMELLHPPVPNGAKLWIHREEYNRVLQRMKVLKSQYGDHQTWREADKREFIQLRDRKYELRKLLGVVV